ncbi:unnamed protein product, partial [Prunus brigantina]
MGRHPTCPVHSTAHAFPYLISLISLKLFLIIFLGLVGILRSSCKLFFLKPLRRSLVFMLILKGIYLLLVFGDPLQMELFHVKSAYELSIGSSWNFIWKLKIPPRVKVFIWLLTQKKILTNVQRPPPCGFFKLNIDGSRVSDCGCIVARVIIRNSYGNSRKSGRCCCFPSRSFLHISSPIRSPLQTRQQ